MAKKPISVTLDPENVLWLRARATARDGRGVSEIVDELVTAARGAAPAGAARSVVGTIDIAGDDPRLERADAIVRAMVDRSVARPFAVKERPPGHRVSRRKPRG